MEIYNATNSTLIEGSNSDDFIENVASSVTILAYNGDDTVEHNYNNSSSLAKVYIDGGKGNDLISGTNPRYYDSTIYGGEGNDSIFATTKSAAGTRNTFFNGDAGNDTISVYTKHYAATLSGGAGDDFISVSGGGDGVGGASYNYNFIRGDAGNDTVYSNATYFEINSGDGNDYIALEGGGSYNTILSGKGDDTIRLSSMNNIVNYGAGTGNDVIFGFNTSDTLKLAESKIVSIGTLGDDVIICTGEKDSLTIKDGADRTLNIQLANGKFMSTVISDSILKLSGTANADSIRSFLDSVIIDAGAGNDSVSISGSAFYQYSGGSLTLKKAKDISFKLKIGNGSAISTVIGSSSDDGEDSLPTGISVKSAVLTANAKFTGSKIDAADYSGVTKITASAVTKNISIVGTAAANSIVGGKGSDIFVYESGNDLITDYVAGQDKIKISSGSITDASLSGSNVILTTGSGNITVICPPV